MILREGEFANRFYLIESGKVVLESGVEFNEPVVIEEIGPGDLLGWSWMFPPYVWHLPPAPSRLQKLSFSTAQFSVNIVNETTR